MSSDARLDALRAWLERVLPVPMRSIAPATSDASFRRYFRITLEAELALPPDIRPSRTLIAMDAPPQQEDCKAYVDVAALLTAAGVHAPAIHAQDLSAGFLLLSDLGPRTYRDVLDEASAPALYRDACTALIAWQLASREGVLPRYDEAMLARELALFPDWYVAKHLGLTLSAAQRATLDAAFRRILDNALGQPHVYVHRDFHSRNLMVSQPNPGVVDFQGAVYGPISYDLISLLRDAYIDWGEEQELDWTVRYWERAREAGLPVATDFGDFWHDFEWMGVQRHLKILGIFARLAHRDGKRSYLADVPRVMRYLRRACDRYRALGPLLQLLNEFEGRQPVAGYTF
jgi:aminoglycoside/choline kinase family phosphotransferase